MVRRMEFATNAGKGQALRAGLGMGRGRYLGFIDADGDISPEFLAPFVSIMRSEEPDIIIGSKRHPESSVHYPPLRRLYSWGYQHLIHLLFRLKVRDTQVGIKLVDRRVIADVLPLLRESRFALDLELLVLAHRLGTRRSWRRRCGSRSGSGQTISLKAVWLLLVDTLGLFVRYSIRHQYDPALRARLNGSAPGCRGGGRAGHRPRRGRGQARTFPATGGPVGHGRRRRGEDGVSSLGLLFGLAGLLVVILIVAVVSAATLSDTTTTTTTFGTTTTTAGGSGST